MNLLRKSIQFLVFSNLFIACCAVAMLAQTTLLLLHEWPSRALIGFVFFSTICSYSFHWYLTEAGTEPSSRNQWLKKFRWIHLVGFFGSAVAVVIFGLSLLPYWRWLAFVAFVTFLYSAPKIPQRHFRMLRKVALGKTIFLAFVWMFVTSMLPLLTSERRWTGDFTLFTLNRFFLIYAICVLFDYRDREYDRSVGIKSLITWLPETAIKALFFLSILVFIAVNMSMIAYDYSGLDIFILIIPGLITAGLHRLATRLYADWLYYFVLDGMMAFSAFITLCLQL